MKRIVVTSVIGEAHTKMASLTMPTQMKYAERIGADYRILRSVLPEHKGTTPHWAKYWLHDILDDYDEALWLDCDVIVSPQAPDIFERVNGRFAAYPEGDIVERMIQFREYWAVINGWVIPHPEKQRYYNSGLFVIPKSAREIMARPDLHEMGLTVKLKRENPNCYFFDQNFMNLRLIRLNVQVEPLGVHWNMMNIPSGKLWDKRTELAHMIHYAGLLNCMGDSVLDMIREDLKKWRMRDETERTL